ncbi:MAG: prolipoprotein diacylglyceryl transferase [Chloroflexota bacterium]|nr:prolipoprotein diacylglyceryl transferase [Dehalococcoidia bacterium]MDW8253339.1 prolipoprotein diacylglyceryl transferase [Chloroflexota bacterium]
MTIAIDPIAFSAGPVQVRWSVVFLALALVAGLIVAQRWGEAVGLRPVSAALLAAAVVAIGIIAGRAAVLIERPDLLRRGVGGAVTLAHGGVSLPAAALGGAAVLTIWALRSSHPPGRVLAAASGGLLVGETIASVGLLISGDYTGALVEVPWAVSYTRTEAGVPATLLARPVHPLALYSLLWMGIAAVWLWLAWPRRTVRERWCLAALAFGLGHLILGYARLDPAWLIGLRADQAFGLVWIVLGAIGIIGEERHAGAAPVPSPRERPLS